jgi:hypothetical protein
MNKLHERLRRQWECEFEIDLKNTCCVNINFIEVGFHNAGSYDDCVKPSSYKTRKIYMTV